MNAELFDQYNALKEGLSVDDIFEKVLEIQTSDVRYDQHEFILRGIACTNKSGRVCIAHSKYILYNLTDTKVFDHIK